MLYLKNATFIDWRTLKVTRGHLAVTPGRCVGAEKVEDDGEPFEAKMKRLPTQLQNQFSESSKLEKAIRERVSPLRTTCRRATGKLAVGAAAKASRTLSRPPTGTFNSYP